MKYKIYETESQSRVEIQTLGAHKNIMGGQVPDKKESKRVQDENSETNNFDKAQTNNNEGAD